MISDKTFFRLSELDRTAFPEFRDRVLRVEEEGVPHEARTYPGYPQWPLERVNPRLPTRFEKLFVRRRSVRKLETTLPSRAVLSRLLKFSHGVTGIQSRGPVPSSGELQSLELYLVVFESAWIPDGLYHYDRAGHYLSQIVSGAARAEWREIVPSMGQFEGGAFLWVIVGDGARIERKYGARGYRFLLLEAGHLMQNLCLLSVSLGLCTLPLGGFFERDIGKKFQLPRTDQILYLGACGKADYPK